MSEASQTADVPEPDTADVPEPEPDENDPTRPPQPDDDEPEARRDDGERCEAETTVGGTLYRCALQADHDGEHSFSPVDAEPEETTHADTNAAREARAKKLGKRAESYSKAVAEIMGPDLDGLIPCELCSPYWPGLRPPLTPPAEVVAALRVLIGMPAIDSFAQDPESDTCATCNGLGRVLTGSKVQQHETIVCPTCDGKGFRSSRDPATLEAATTTNGNGHARDDEPEPDVPDHDPWGRPRGDPDFYRMPIPGAS